MRLDRTDIEAYIGLLILCGVYKFRNENVASLWDADTGRAIFFRATMFQQTFHVLSRVIRFDNRSILNAVNMTNLHRFVNSGTSGWRGYRSSITQVQR